MSNRVLNIKPDVDRIDTGVEKHKQLAAGLCGALADTYLLMVKTQAFHWNAVGPLFHSVHTSPRSSMRICSRPPMSSPSGSVPSATRHRPASPT
jgi:hypothetical protein